MTDKKPHPILWTILVTFLVVGLISVAVVHFVSDDVLHKSARAVDIHAASAAQLMNDQNGAVET